MTNENVMTPDDSRFELPDVDSLFVDTPSEEPAATEPEKEPSNDVSDIDPYLGVDNPDEESSKSSSADALHQFLMDRGISDTTKVQYEDEDGNPTEVDFDTLPVEEQLSIINELSKPNLSEDEVATIDYLRKNGVTFSEAVEYFANQRLQQYIESTAQNITPNYLIDDYSDDELYLADLKAKYPNFSNDKLVSKLESAKADMDLFNEEVNELRSFYKRQEEDQLAYQRQEEIAAQEQYRNTLYDALNNFNEIALDYTDDKSDTLEIEVEDKRKSLSYLLDADAEGKSQFARDIENPDALIELAWLRTCGAEALSGQSKYYKEIISERNREIARLKKQIEREKTSNSVVVPTETKRASKNSSSPWDQSGLLE